MSRPPNASMTVAQLSSATGLANSTIYHLVTEGYIKADKSLTGRITFNPSEVPVAIESRGSRKRYRCPLCKHNLIKDCVVRRVNSNGLDNHFKIHVRCDNCDSEFTSSDAINKVRLIDGSGRAPLTVTNGRLK